MTFLFEFVFFIYWSERHFKGIIIIYWCNLIGATCFMVPVKIGFHSLDWFEPRIAYRENKQNKTGQPLKVFVFSLVTDFFHFLFLFLLLN